MIHVINPFIVMTHIFASRRCASLMLQWKWLLVGLKSFPHLSYGTCQSLKSLSACSAEHYCVKLESLLTPVRTIKYNLQYVILYSFFFTLHSLSVFQTFSGVRDILFPNWRHSYFLNVSWRYLQWMNSWFSGLLCHVLYWLDTNVSEDWRWKQHSPL